MHPLHAAFADELVKVGAAAARSTLTPGSSNVRGFRYEPSTKELFITYKSGGTYRYADVEPGAARALGRAKSVGRAVNKHVKAPGLAYEKVGMPASAIARIVRRTLETNPDRVGRFIRRTGASSAPRMQAAKNIAVSEARQFLAGTTTFRGKRAGNVLPAVSGEFQTRFGSGGGVKTAGIPFRAWGKQIIEDALNRIFAGRPRPGQRRKHEKRASMPAEASSIVSSMRSMSKAAGVAKKQVSFQGLPLKIEHEPGDVRSGKSKEGKTWSRPMYDSYGYVPGTKGKAADGDAIDVYLAKDPVDGPAFKIEQLKKGTGEYDEDKFMLGFGSADAAKKAYLRHMPTWAFGDMSQVGETFEDFKTLVRS